MEDGDIDGIEWQDQIKADVGTWYNAYVRYLALHRFNCVALYTYSRLNVCVCTCFAKMLLLLILSLCFEVLYVRVQVLRPSTSSPPFHFTVREQSRPQECEPSSFFPSLLAQVSFACQYIFGSSPNAKASIQNNFSTPDISHFHLFLAQSPLTCILERHLTTVPIYLSSQPSRHLCLHFTTRESVGR